MESREFIFQVEEAGCDSCAARVTSALAPVATVESIEVDADADEATVRVRPAGALSQAAVDEALEQASEGTHHRYRVKPGSWQSAS
jgi:copper chaperone CopZ